VTALDFQQQNSSDNNPVTGKGSKDIVGNSKGYPETADNQS